MKKSIFALILSAVLLFGGCDLNALMSGFDVDAGESFSSMSDSVSNSSDSGSSDSSDGGNSDSSDGGNSDSSDGGNSDSSDGGNSDSSDGGNSDSSDGGNSDECGEEHVDENNDEKCDDCSVSVVATFDFFSVNDLHGKFTDSDSQPGVDELTTYLKNAKADNEYTMFFSSGDMWQGGSESNLTKGLIVTDWMSQLGFTSMALGNHEYDWGSEYIRKNADLANFPFLAINIYDNATNQRVDYCDASVLVELGAVKVGVIGAIGNCYSSISGDKVQDVYFKTGSALTSLVKAEANSLRAQGADFIVYTVHDGYDAYDVALSDYVDLVFEGHTHQSYTKKDAKGVYHLQDGGDNDGISHAQVKINFANEKAVVEEAKFISTSVYSSLPDDPLVGELLTKYRDQISGADRVLGTNDKVRNSKEILQKTADLYYETGLERWGDDYDIVLGGGFMQARSPYDLHAGEVVYGDLMSIMPFDNQLVLCSISGSKLKSRFFALPSNYYISYGDYGASVKNSIVSSKTYYVVTDTYSLQYAPNGLTEVARYDETTFARDLLAKFIENGGWGEPVGEVKLTSIPEAIGIAKKLDNDVETTEVYYVKGKIISITSPELYGNVTIEDEDGNTLYVYGTWDKTGKKRYGVMDNPPKVGDTVVLVGAMKNYNGTFEMMNGRFYSVE